MQAPQEQSSNNRMRGPSTISTSPTETRSATTLTAPQLQPLVKGSTETSLCQLLRLVDAEPYYHCALQPPPHYWHDLHGQDGPSWTREAWWTALQEAEACACRARGHDWNTLRRLDHPEEWLNWSRLRGEIADWRKPRIPERLNNARDNTGYDWHTKRWYHLADIRGMLPEDLLAGIRVYQICSSTGLVLRMADFASECTPHHLLYDCFDFQAEAEFFICGAAVYSNPFAPPGSSDLHDGLRVSERLCGRYCENWERPWHISEPLLRLSAVDKDGAHMVVMAAFVQDKFGHRVVTVTQRSRLQLAW